MAKKVRKKLEEDEAAREFAFPHFDVREFVIHELEQSYATALALVFAALLALVSWQLTLLGSPGGAASGVGVLALSRGALALGAVWAFAMSHVLRRVRPKSEEYRRGDGASLVLVYVFLWLGLWALFLNV